MFFKSLIATALLASSVAAAPLQARAEDPAYNDINNGKCSPVTFIFARGTLEGGTIGSLVGPYIIDGLKAVYSDIAIQGVDYPATIESNYDAGTGAGRNVTLLMQKARSQCSHTKIVISGYSQGAMVVTQGGGGDPNDVTAVVMYGNPFHPGGDKVNGVSQDKIASYCAAGDGVCETGTFNITQPHLTYGTSRYIADGVAFVQARVGSSSTPTTPSTPTTTPTPTTTSTPTLPSFGFSFPTNLPNPFSGFTLPTGFPALPTFPAFTGLPNPFAGFKFP